MSTLYSRITDDLTNSNTIREVSLNHIRIIYCNACFSAFTFLILLIIAIELGPVVNDAGVLIKDASISLKDFSILLPEINRILPEAQNTTRILGRMIPMIKNGMYQLNQICDVAPNCH